MVTTKTSKPAYSLAEINRLAATKNIRAYHKVVNDVSNLGYSAHDVRDCLRDLQPHHYRHTVLYDDDESPYDVYQCDWSPTANPSASDSLYIKLRLNDDCTEIALASFHLS